MRSTEGLVYLLIFEVVFQAGNSDSYFIPIHFSNTRPIKKALIQKISLEAQEGYLMDALYLESFRNMLLKHIIKKSRLNYPDAELFFGKGKILSRDKTLKRIESRMLSAEQSNTTLVYNDKYYLKMYRRLFIDLNPDYELTQFLTESAGFKNSPFYTGSINLKFKRFSGITLGLMQQKVPNQGNAWDYFTAKIKSFFDRVVVVLVLTTIISWVRQTRTRKDLFIIMAWVAGSFGLTVGLIFGLAKLLVVLGIAESGFI